MGLCNNICNVMALSRGLNLFHDIPVAKFNDPTRGVGPLTMRNFQIDIPKSFPEHCNFPFQFLNPAVFYVHHISPKWGEWSGVCLSTLPLKLQGLPAPVKGERGQKWANVLCYKLVTIAPLVFYHRRVPEREPAAQSINELGGAIICHGTLILTIPDYDMVQKPDSEDVRSGLHLLTNLSILWTR